MTARARFKQSEIERLIRAVKKTVDKPITGVEAIPGGGVRILTGEPANDPAPGLDAELEAWGKKHGYG